MIIRNLDSEKVWDYENAFYWFSGQARLAKALAQYELYKRIIDLPGHVFEFGVYKGASLIRLATFRAMLENDLSRKIVGFDAYGEFPRQKLEMIEDQEFIDRFEAAGADGLDDKELAQILKEKGFVNIELVKGNVFDTLPKYLFDHPETRVSFLHLDLTVREPSEAVLDQLFDRVVSGGLIVFDDYNAVAGETEATDDFLATKNLKLQKVPYYHVPAFAVKE